jgi:hypothetical protein
VFFEPGGEMVGFGVARPTAYFHDGEAGGTKELTGLMDAGLGNEAEGAGLEL